MGYFYFIPAYIAWHYSQAYRDISRVWTNFLWFIYNFFSIPLLLKTFFSPWHRIREKRTQGAFSLEDVAEAVFATTVMRFIGAALRFMIISVGIVLTLIVFWAGVFFFVLWTLFPAALFASFIYGFLMLLG